VTNDLPPRTGGIQQFVGNLLDRVHPSTTTVIGPGGEPGAEAHDAAQPYRTVRARGTVLPTPATRHLVETVAADARPDVVVLGASWPLGELAPSLTDRLGVPVVSLSHGLEAGLPGVGLGVLVRRATRGLAALTTISDWTESRLAPHVRAARVVRVPPGVDVGRFTSDADGAAMRRSWEVPADAPLVGCISRLVPRKGQDVLVEVWPRVRERHPDAWLVLVGEGPLERRLARAVDDLGPDSQVVLAGRAAWDDLPACYAALDVFAMPCRTRLAGTDVEGLGIVYLEAAACGVPAVAGRSGGAPEAVRDGVTGSVVDGRDRDALVVALDRWLRDPRARDRAGAAGRAWVEERWSWEAIAARFATLLDEVVEASTGAATAAGTVPLASGPVAVGTDEEHVRVEAVVTIPGAEPWSARGEGERAEVGVIVTHGFTANPLGTRPLGQRLASAGFTVEVPCLPGHGTSIRDFGRSRYAHWYRALERTYEHLARGCEKIVLVGHSMGGTLSLDLATRRPDKVAGVVAINAQVSDPVQPLAKVAPVLQYVLPYVPRDLAGLPSDDIAKPGVEEGAYGIVSARAAQSLIAQLPRIRRQLPTLEVPLLAVWSPQDHSVPPENSVVLQELVGSDDVTELVCERSYHVPQLDYDAERVEEAVLAFVARVTGT
jgi:glycosyltransferase involved in cell wall biosynthesis/esterase/lipase